MPFGNDIDLSWNMSNWYLIRRLLNLDLLIAYKLTLFDLQDELTLDLVLHTPNTWALKLWRESLEIDDLINFHTTGITSINSHLHTWLDVAASRDDSLDSDQRTDVV
jgi:hypothetical protein